MAELDGVYYKEIVEQALREFPNEACGLIAAEVGVPVKVYAMTNVDASPATYRLGLLVKAVEYLAQGKGREARPLPPDLQWMINRRADVDATLHHAAGRAREGGVTARTYAREGDPADAILDVAEELSADLIVVGNKGMTGAKRFLLGSVPNKISHHAPCAVLIIRTS